MKYKRAYDKRDFVSTLFILGSLKFRYSEKAIKFEKNFHLKFGVTD